MTTTASPSALENVAVSASLRERLDGAVFVNATWFLSGGAFGLAIAFLFSGSVALWVLSPFVCAILTVLAGGIRRFVLGGVIVVAAVSAILGLTAIVSSSESWDMRWLEPLSLIAFAAVVLVMRRTAVGEPVSSGWQVHAIELLASATALVIAGALHSRLSEAGASHAGNFLMYGEDNDAWLNVVARSPSLHSVTGLSAAAQGSFGPVVPTYLAFVRTLETGVFPGRFGVNTVPTVVLLGYFVLLVASPALVAAFVPRLLAHRTFFEAVFAWLAGTFILAGTICVLAFFGFLTACLALVLILCVALIYREIPTLDVPDAASLLPWIGFAVVIFSMGAVWVPLIPLAALAIAALCLVPLSSWIRTRGYRPGLRLLACVMCAGLLELALLHQYRVVTSPLAGGASNLLQETGGTSATTPLVQSLCVLLLGAVYLTSMRRANAADESQRGLLLPMLFIAGFLTAILLAEAWVARTTEYGSEKLSIVLLSALALLGLFQLLSSAGWFPDRRGGAALVVVVVLALTFQQGPLYEALANHWPTQQGTASWIPAVDQEVAHGKEVLCLQAVNPVVRGGDNNDAYWCTRWATSVVGLDNQLSLDWRETLLGDVPASLGVDAVKAAPRGNVVLLVIGPGSIHLRSEWWAPLARLPGFLWLRVAA
jgi:hypothetical protein